MGERVSKKLLSEKQRIKRAGRKRIEDARWPTYDKYRLIIENIEEGYYEIDLAGNLIFFNHALSRIHGYSQDELKGMNYWQYLDGGNIHKISQTYERVYRTGEPCKQCGLEVIRKDGTHTYIDLSIVLQKDSSGKPVGFIGIIQDITKRKQAEELFRKSDFQYRLLAENIKDQIWLMDLHFKPIYASPSVEKTLGYPFEELKDLPFDKLLNLIEPKSLEKVKVLLSAMMPINVDLSDDIFNNAVEVELRCKDGRAIWEEIRCSFIRDENGKAKFILCVGRDITERKRAEELLRQSEFQYRLLADHMKDFVILQDLKLQPYYVSPSLEKLLGYTFKELTELPFEKLLHLIDPNSLEKVQNLLSKKLPITVDSPDDILDQSVELELLCKDGRTIWEEFKSSFIRDEDGKAISILSVGRDITERKRAEELLRQSEFHYRLLADNMKDQVWLEDLNLNLFYASPSVKKLLGYTLEELNTVGWDKILVPDSLDYVMDLMSEMPPLSMDSPDDILGRLTEVEIRCKDGRTVWEEIRCSFIRDKNGKALYLLGQGRDITERKKMENALKKSEERYRSVFENAGLPMIILEASLRIFMVNERFVEMSGYEKEEIEGKMRFTDFIDAEDRDDILKGFSRPKEDKLVEYEYRIAHRGGEKFDVLIRIGRIPGIGQFIASFTDITTRKRAEAALLENTENLQKENIRLRSSIRERYRFHDIIGKSPSMQEVYEFILQAAATQANVIIYGESGTGKELVAKAIHETSDRRKKGLVTVHCGAIPETLMESEFFGYKRGAFTGANADKLGYLDQADGGTLFLDEVGEISLVMQVKLLRAISGDGYTPVGSSMIKKADVRIIAATNRNLRDLVKEGVMREDFFYRIHILPVNLPPLRERKDDIPLLIDHFLQLHDVNHPPLPGHITESLRSYDWPGNIRELQNVLHRYVTLKRLDFAGMPARHSIHLETKTTDDSALFNEGAEANNGNGSHGEMEPCMGGMQKHKLPMAMMSIEREHIMQALLENKWHRHRTATALGISRKTLFRKMQKFDITES
jgi:PAS domain S-box-containing protein